MSEPGLSHDEDAMSPDMFHDIDTMIPINNATNSDDSNSTSIDTNEPEPSDDVPEWKGVSMDEVRKGLGIYDCQEMPPICPSSSHTVLISLPLSVRGPPKSYPTHHVDKWCQGYVRMPHSTHSMYPIDQNGSRPCRNRWEIIQESLLQNFVSSQQLEKAILSYNHIYAHRWDFTALHHFFAKAVDEEERNMFFKTLLPKMVQLALQLPVLVTGPVPLLKRHTNATISLSQLQVASLLANAFFCTFPRRNSTNPHSEYGAYPYINFNRAAPEGVITIQRRYIPKQDCPKWDRLHQKLPPLHLTSKGTIETDGAGLLQVDFANKYVGGGVLGLGCVQEEIRFSVCPELIVTMLLTEELDDTEALIVSGIERYSKYKGYSNTFKWMGDFIDETPRDSSGRRLTSIVAIDALYFKQSESQFCVRNISRELNKAYVGFLGCDGNKGNLPAIATGNWGCGAFRGNPKLKVLLQLMAAAASGRSMVYFTFGDRNLRDDVFEMYWHLVQHETDIAHLFSLFVQYRELAATGDLDFYRFLYSRTKIKSLSKYFVVKSKNPETDPSKKEEETFKGNKSLNNDHKLRFHYESKPKGTAEDGRIPYSLEDLNEDILGNEKIDSSKKKFEDLERNVKENEQSANTAMCKTNVETNRITGGEGTEIKRNLSFWKIAENKVQNEIGYECPLSGLDALDRNHELILKDICDDALITVKHQPTVNSKDANNKCKTATILSDRSIVSHKYDLAPKQTGQRKILDYLQRTS